jgi:hypothetical protein
VSGDVILRMTERNSSAKKLVLKDWGNQWKVSYYFESDSTSESPELPHYFVLFCFRTRNILGTIYSQSHWCFYIVKNYALFVKSS